MEGAVEEVETFCWYVSFPEGEGPFFAENLLQGSGYAFVDWGSGEETVEGVTEGVDLELEADFYYVEGGYAESGGCLLGSIVNV